MGIPSLVGFPAAVHAATPLQSLSVTQEMSATVSINNEGDYNTPVASRNGHVAWTYIDSNNNVVVQHLSTSGVTNTRIIAPITQSDQYHCAPSIAFDKNGYLHLAGDMHGGEWRYWVSNNAYDITGGFTSKTGTTGAIPGRWITYANFATDRSNELYVAYRLRVVNEWGKGAAAGAIAKYDATAKTWSLLGDINYTKPPGNWATGSQIKTMFYVNDGPSDNNGYQSYKVKMAFDLNNRLHVTTQFYTSDAASNYTISDGPTYIVYTYSDDGGVTWKKAGGATIASLPISPTSGEIVFKRLSGTAGNMSQVTFGNDFKPIVSYSAAGNKNMRWNGTSWAALSQTMNYHGFILSTDRTNLSGTPRTAYISAVDINSTNTQIVRSNDNGSTVQRYNIGYNNGIALFDFENFKMADVVRFTSQPFATAGGGTAYVLRANLTDSGSMLASKPSSAIH